jgi:hypothetical protein
MLAIGVGLDVLVVLLFLGAPASIGPLSVEPPSVVALLVVAAAVVVNVVGLAWMARIYRASTEAGASFWRFHRS